VIAEQTFVMKADDAGPTVGAAPPPASLAPIDASGEEAAATGDDGALVADAEAAGVAVGFA
jgi:hypothetical protein